jgi:serine/threonine protein kinase
MADVYLAFDPLNRRDVALKVLAQGPQAAERLRRFEREARAGSSTKHPNIVSVFEIGWQDRMPYMAQEYVDGSSLRARIAEGRLSPREAARLGAQIADGLQAAHDAGIVHRDLKPDNIMLAAPDDAAKILDFGLSKRISAGPSDEEANTDELLTVPGTILGTLDYMSPEQARGDRVSFRSDQFSLGAILYEMTTGIVPFARESVSRTLAAIIDGKPSGLDAFEAAVPPRLRAVIEKTLAKRPEDRFPTMRHLASALRRSRAPSWARLFGLAERLAG